MTRASQALAAELRRLHPIGIDLGLGRMLGLLEALGHPEQRLPPVVHVAGTNGKGSVIAFLRAMLEADDRRVSCYLSPPLGSLHDAIRLPGADGISGQISEEQLAAALGRVLAANAGAPLTSFEGETAAAFLAFAETPADVLLLEVGMGGRGDATNVVDRPAVSVLTPISLDHQGFLGGTLAGIARHKAGIIKRGRPCVVARQERQALDVIEAEADRLRAPLILFGRDFEGYGQHGRFIFQHEAGLLDLPMPVLAGRHQVENAAVAIAAGQQLGRLAPSERAIERGLATVRWPGRMQMLAHGGLASLLAAGSELWLDGGHNAAAAQQIAEAFAALEERSPKPLHLVLGMLRSKHPDAYLSHFVGLAASVTGIAIPDVSRAYAPSLTSSEIEEAAARLGLPASSSEDVEEGLAAIAASANGPVRVLIAGSLHLAGHVLALEAASRAGRSGPRG